MIRFTEEADLEDFWLKELEKSRILSFRLAILAGFRRILPNNWFSSLIKKDTFLAWLDAVEQQLQRWEEGGRPPDEETVIALLKLRAGMAYEAVLEQAVEEALSKPTLRQTRYEANLELNLREQAIRKKVYRVCKSLQAAGFSVRHRSKVSAEFIAKIRAYCKEQKA